MRTPRIPLAALAAACAFAAAPAVAQTTLTISSWLPHNHTVTRSIMEWAAEVEKASGGRIKHTLLAKAVTSPPGTFDAIRDGLADVSWTVDGYTPGRFLLTRVAEFPFLGDTSEINSIAYQRIHERHMAKADEHKGVKVLAVFAHGPGGIFTTKKAIRAVADFKGLKIRIGGGIVTDLAKELDINVLLRPASETYEILSNGIADGAFSSAEAMSAFKLEKLIKYHTYLPGGLYNTSFAIFMNPAAYAKLSAQDKAVIDAQSGEKLARVAGRNWNDADASGLAALKANNAEFIAADKAMIDAVRAKVQGMETAWYTAAKAKGVDGARALADLREEIRKVAATK
ncbi:MAG: TRAP transporter substrate-binding protein [Betaproteobacteria bacterium]|nr:TRAP transporter substrate-binding protein [Betaproteobacteria bacterium]